MRSFIMGRHGRRQNRRAARSRRTAGFTFLEGIVVIAAVGVVLVIGLPSLMQQLSRNQLEGSANSVANLMRQTRLRAIRDNATYVVELGGTSTTVEGVGLVDDVVLDFTPPDSKVEVYTDALGPPYCTEFETDGSQNHYGLVATFESTGTAAEPAAICVHDNAGNILQVAVDFTSGQPRIRKYLPGAVAPGGNAGFYQKATGSTADPDTWTAPVWVWF